MEELHWPLTILSRAVAYKNISSASSHIGLSQPQISRHIRKIEDELGLVIIDKSSPRHASWTPQAYQLAKVYQRSTQSLEHSLFEISNQQKPKSIKMATLEGLSVKACLIVKSLMEDHGLSQVFLDVFDQNDMEAKFLSGDLDLLLTSRLPISKKSLPSKIIGYQKLDLVKSKSDYRIQSPFEYIQSKRVKEGKNQKNLVTNSLAIRKYWLENFGGHGLIPRPIETKEQKNSLPVMLVGHEHLHQGIVDFLFTKQF